MATSLLIGWITTRTKFRARNLLDQLAFVSHGLPGVILGLALMVFSLIEREARRALAPDKKVPNLLAGHVAARPTGDNLFKALRDIALVTFEIAGVRQQHVADLTPLQRTLLPLLRVPEAAYTRLNS